MSDAAFLQVWSCAAASIVAAAACAGGVLARGTTAVPAAAWACAAAAVFALEMGCRAGGALADPAAIASVRLVAVALSLCPTMSLLGAKRPQHGVWQFIVGSLACVLAMPAAAATLVRPGSMPDVHVLQRWFMPLLILVGWMNFVGTRHGLAAAAIAAGQMILARSFLPFVSETTIVDSAAGDCLGATAVAAGAGIAALQSIMAPVALRAGVRGPAAAVGVPFLALRETVGAAWTLRIAERFNAVAESRGWPCRLRFTGLDVGGDPDDDSWHHDASRAARALLRRFVSEDWLHRHTPPVEKTGPPVAPTPTGH
jgi:hypothetical protein